MLDKIERFCIGDEQRAFLTQQARRLACSKSYVLRLLLARAMLENQITVSTAVENKTKKTGEKTGKEN
ncbi:MAG: hypothetical protein AABZ39_07565 [Spirochaetota bacterium]